jgi:tRNA (mo5U34)-methyltransferase
MTTGGKRGAYASPETAQRFIERTDFIWHQRFELAPGVYAPGANDIEWLLGVSELPPDLEGLSVLDVGTTNGGAAFLAERRGASRVVAIDIFGPHWFGFSELSELLGSEVEYRRVSAYELAGALDEQFDIVLFFGVLYHLRHPLLALDNLRAVSRDRCYLETAVADHENPELARSPVARFYRTDELGGDSSNWFVPTIAALQDWCVSSGFDSQLLAAWPSESPSRCMVKLQPATGDPEFAKLSYERPFGRLPDAPGE